MTDPITPHNSAARMGWLRWLRVQHRCSPLTAYGRDLRRRIREPHSPADYVEVERPVSRDGA